MGREPCEHSVYETVVKINVLHQEAIIPDYKPESSLYDSIKIENQ